MEQQNRRQVDESIWDPEKAYQQEKSRNFRLIVFILLVAAIAGIWTWLIQRDRAMGGDVPMKSTMSFEEAERKLLDAGFEPTGEPYQNEDATIREYDGRNIYGFFADISVLEVSESKDGGVCIEHVFYEEPGHDGDHPGEVCAYMKRELTRRMGEPEELRSSTGSYWRWKRDSHSYVQLGYLTESCLIVYYVYPR